MVKYDMFLTGLEIQIHFRSFPSCVHVCIDKLCRLIVEWKEGNRAEFCVPIHRSFHQPRHSCKLSPRGMSV